MSHRRPAKLFDQHIEYIDPTNSRSAVGYVIYKSVWGGFCAEVELISCDRKINWDFNNSSQEGYKMSLAKIDTAISMLMRFRESFVTHGIAFRKSKKRK